MQADIVGYDSKYVSAVFSDFYKQTDFPRHSLGGKESSLGTTSVAQPQVHEDNALVKKPLFWTSVISVFISVVATIILVVLCTCKKARSVLALRRIRRTQPSQTRMPAQGANKKGESFTGTISVLQFIYGMSNRKQIK